MAWIVECALLATLSAIVSCGSAATMPTAPAPPLVALAAPLRTVQKPEPEAAAEETLAEEAEQGDDFEVSDTGLGHLDLRVGTGPAATNGSRVAVHYEGRLADGSVFDSSRERNRPFTFELGSGLVIPGWDEGVVGMRVGGLRRLIIPPSLAYGARGAPPKIPPEAILEFDIELLETR